MNEWGNNRVLIRSCGDCSRLLKTINSEYATGRKKEGAKQELAELLEEGKVSQVAKPYISKLVGR